jgi:hypothetical protein
MDIGLRSSVRYPLSSTNTVKKKKNSILGEEVVHKYTEEVKLRYFFDTEVFKPTIHTMCSQMKLYKDPTLDGEKDINDIGVLKTPNALWTKDLYHNTSQSFLVGRQRCQAWLDELTHEGRYVGTYSTTKEIIPTPA